MKIVIDTRWIRSLKIDGIANFTLNVVKELINLTPENEYILLINSHSVLKYLNKFISSGNNNYSFYFINSTINSPKNFFQIPKIISKIKPDIFFSPSLPFFSNIIKNTKHITVVHDLIPVIFPEMFENASLKFKLFYCNKFIQKKILKYPDKVISVSESTKKDLKKYLNIQKEIHVISEGVRTLYIKIKSEEEKYFLFVGRHDKYKNITGLIRTYIELPKSVKEKYKLLIVGAFNDYHTPELKKMSNNEKNIEFIDSVMPDKLPNLYKNAKLLIHLSLYEGFGLTVLEAMSYGIPVIAFNISSIPEVVGNSGILNEVNNYKQVKDNIIKIINDNEYYNELSKKSLERSKLFNWENTAKQLNEIFNS